MADKKSPADQAFADLLKQIKGSTKELGDAVKDLRKARVTDSKSKGKEDFPPERIARIEKLAKKQKEAAQYAEETAEANRKNLDYLGKTAPSLSKLVELEKTWAESAKKDLLPTLQKVQQSFGDAFDMGDEAMKAIDRISKGPSFTIPPPPPPPPPSGPPPPAGPNSTPPPLPSERERLLRQLVANEPGLPPNPNEGYKHVPGLGMVPDYDHKNFAEPLKEVRNFEEAQSHAFIVPEKGKGLLHYLDEYLDKLRKLNKEAGRAKKGGILDKASMALRGSPGAVAVAGIGSLATAGLGGVASILSVVKEAFFKTWEYIDTKVLPTTSLLNRTLGASAVGMGNLSGEAMRLGGQFWDLGLGFEQGVKDATDIAAAMKTVNIPRANLDTLVKVAEYVGVGAEQAGRLGRSFEATGGNVKDLNAIMKDAVGVQMEFGVPANIIRKDFAENIDLLQRFGTRNAREFQRAIGRAQSYGLSIREVNGAFGEAMDTFEATSDTAAKLNQAFGTNIDSLKLLRETDPTKRFEMIRKELERQHIVWDTINPFYKNLLKQTLPGLTDETGALAFGTQKLRNETKKQMDVEKGRAKSAKEWDNAMGSLRTQLLSLDKTFSDMFRAIGNVVLKFLGFDDGISGTTDLVGIFKQTMEGVTAKINEFAATMPKGGGAGFVSYLEKIAKIIDDVDGSFMHINNTVHDFFTLGEGNSTSIADRFAKAAKDPEKYASEILSLQEEMSHVDALSGEQSKPGDPLSYDTISPTRIKERAESLRKIQAAGIDRESVIERARAQKKKDEQRSADTSNIMKGGFMLPDANDWRDHPIINIYLDGDNIADSSTARTVVKSAQN